MSENNKKRAGSFRKLFPNLFFSHKSKDKNKETQSNIKSSTESSKGNQYHNPRSIRSDKSAPESGDSERIYENLTTRRPQSDNETLSNEISSHHSSSSTLVSESTKNKSIDTNEVSETESIAYSNKAARPQVPPKPYNEMSHSPHTSSRNNQLHDFDKTHYPDVYYHSLEKLSDKISPLDEIEIYRASQAQANPASVGAEIKRVSTKFLISPKKEAEVRTIQPTRARSLSFDNNNAKENEESKKVRYYNKREESIKKPYNYSAPTSPMPISHKIPNMPKTVSPYEHVRKAMIETEEKRNSLSRNSLRNKSTPSPRSDYRQQLTPTPQDNSKQDSKDKEKTRQKVEAFYWQKLKELKQKEDEYLIKQSLNSSPVRLKPAYNSNCSTPNSFSFIMDSRSCSLPRGKDLKSSPMNQSIYSSSPFARGAPERRTDTFIKRQITVDDPEIIYRHPEKLITRTASPDLHDLKLRNYFRGTIPQQNSGTGLSKRVSFEEKYGKTSNSVLISARELKINDNKMQNRQTELNVTAHKASELQSRVPPRPPVRTTSVGGTGKNIKLGNNKKIMHLSGAVHSLCSESESGSEAGEIQRILKTNAQKVGDVPRYDVIAWRRSDDRK
ncbi:unnamed protein product [Chrysodeixis includens]|uniref:Uncharacterized protein n=1 Tax=Chrysodeixis includens TaxID=689277 RepID=A0A9N8KTB9_CHRIL|nr:unnamed protein product [Chrysodeixis includens]